MTTPSLITYPARPVNGGHLSNALPKIGDWYYEPKLNGWRAVLHVPTGTMWNRHGKLLSIQSEFKEAISQLQKTPFEWLDVEALERRHGLGRGSLIALDTIIDGKTYKERRFILMRDLWECGPAEPLPFLKAPKQCAVYIIDSCAETTVSDGVFAKTADANDLWRLTQDANKRLGCDFYEGLVAKKADSLYPIQLNSPEQTFPGWMKHRFA